jgi:hypothetical protein
MLRQRHGGARSALAERLQRFERRFDGAELGGERVELRFESALLLVFWLAFGSGYGGSGRLRSFSSRPPTGTRRHIGWKAGQARHPRRLDWRSDGVRPCRWGSAACLRSRALHYAPAHAHQPGQRRPYRAAPAACALGSARLHRTAANPLMRVGVPAGEAPARLRRPPFLPTGATPAVRPSWGRRDSAPQTGSASCRRTAAHPLMRVEVPRREKLRLGSAVLPPEFMGENQSRPQLLL